MKKIFLLLAILMISSGMLVVSSCVNTSAEIDFTVESDFSHLVAAIENANRSLEERMSLLETAMESGLASEKDALALIRKAVESLNGDLEKKLAAVMEAVKSHGTNLETKLAIIEAAVEAGFSDWKTQQTLLDEAVASLGGSLEDKMTVIESSMKSRFTSLDTKLGLIEVAVQNGLADNQKSHELLKKALESLDGSMEERLSTLDKAMKSQASGLGTKLELIQETLTNGFTDDKTALELISTAMSSIKGTVDGIDQDVDAVVATIGTLDPTTTGTVSEALAILLSSVSLLPDYQAALEEIQNKLFLLTADAINGYLYVDMGSGLKWATMNVGATSPEESGDYFAWAETTTKTDYTIDTYKYILKEAVPGGYEYKLTKYMMDTRDPILEVEDDVASQSWGATWRTPTKEELEWLKDHCSWEWVEYNGVKGMMATSRVQGYESKQLFFPAAGFYKDENPAGLVDTGIKGFYMSNGVVSTNNYYEITYLQIQADAPALESLRRWCGFSVRPVSY